MINHMYSIFLTDINMINFINLIEFLCRIIVGYSSVDAAAAVFDESVEPYASFAFVLLLFVS